MTSIAPGAHYAKFKATDACSIDKTANLEHYVVVGRAEV
ncbi:hypothetical protein I546_5789 [Mycobacterium kansasii 732]|uniref:Uncharacterized protein n=1 Tax=Mycobacterium kansasii 662 TaxID=1299326 RepID=X7YZF4_MYCKA|nr:hypothetical protein I546_5789 [Mycobacterium kansasii 732]EUA12479.1 hypothetical protein I545_5144 [Mycobacterium kansasii 662]